MYKNSIFFIKDMYNNIHKELTEFAQAIIHGRPVRVSVIDGYQAMDVAHQVLKKMSLHAELHNV